MKSEISLIIGRRIREIRISKGKSMTTLAHESEMEYIQLSRIELGKINTTVYQLMKICSALNVKIEELFTDINVDNL